MRYFIYYPTTKTSRQIDVVDGTQIQQVIDMVQHEFGIQVDTDSQSKKAIVLNYNGSDLKPTWLLTDLNIPPGAIIHCLHREKRTPDLHVHCGFNNQILEFFDDTITMDTTVGEIREKIADRIGLPLSTFCLQMHNSKRNLYDQMELFHYEIQPHDHLSLKVWRGYEKFLNSCMKGFPKYYAHDDLTRHYELQIALHIAAFYGFMELAHSALKLGARSDFPVGVHPSRQWSSEATVQDLPAMLKSPIHVAIERGHMKIVDLFVRRSLLCTQALHPISGFLPYRMALSLCLRSKKEAEKQRYSQIYLYLYDKQFNLKISLNTHGSSITSLLTSSLSGKSSNRSSGQNNFFSLPRYCKIISSIEIKRANQSKGLLGYKVMIDGFNNTFDVPNESTRRIGSDRKSQADQTVLCIGFTDEEREKILKMEASMKQFRSDEQQLRSQHSVSNNLKKTRHPPVLAQSGLMGAKLQAIELPPATASVIHEAKKHALESFPKLIVGTRSSSNSGRTQTSVANPSSLSIDQHEHNRMLRRWQKIIPKALVPMPIHPCISFVVNDKKEHEPKESYTESSISTLTLNVPTVQATGEEQLNMEITSDMTSDRQEDMSSTDAYIVSSALIATDEQQRRIVAKRERMVQIKQAVDYFTEKSAEERRSPVAQIYPIVNRSINPYLPLPARQLRKNIGPIQSRYDLKIQQATIKPYESYARESIQESAVGSLQEADFFKRKSWSRKVEISQEMVRRRIQRCIRPNDETKINCVLSPMRAMSVLPSPDEAI